MSLHHEHSNFLLNNCGHACDMTQLQVIFAGPHKFDPYTLVEARLITCRMMSSETYLIFFKNEKIGNFIQINVNSIHRGSKID